MMDRRTSMLLMWCVDCVSCPMAALYSRDARSWRLAFSHRNRYCSMTWCCIMIVMDWCPFVNWQGSKNLNETKFFGIYEFYHICDFLIMVLIFRAIFTLPWWFCGMSSHRNDSWAKVKFCTALVLYCILGDRKKNKWKQFFLAFCNIFGTQPNLECLRF